MTLSDRYELIKLQPLGQGEVARVDRELMPDDTQDGSRRCILPRDLTCDACDAGAYGCVWMCQARDVSDGSVPQSAGAGVDKDGQRQQQKERLVVKCIPHMCNAEECRRMLREVDACHTPARIAPLSHSHPAQSPAATYR